MKIWIGLKNKKDMNRLRIIKNMSQNLTNN